MIHQQVLFEQIPRKYIEAIPETSLEARQSVDLKQERRIAYEVIRSFGWRGCTADELEKISGRGHQRIVELRRLGKIVKKGERRMTRSGRRAEVWIAR